MFNQIKKVLDKRLKLTNSAVDTARQAKVLADRAIAAAHSDAKKAKVLLRQAKGKIKKLRPLLKDVRVGSQINLAFQEYAEAEILLALLDGKKLPKVAVGEEAYLLGLCDAIGELQRAFLVAKKSGDEKKALFLLKKATEIQDALQVFDYPDYLVSGLRRSKDRMRHILNQMLQA